VTQIAVGTFDYEGGLRDLKDALVFVLNRHSSMIPSGCPREPSW
jgi:hypothetical protein